MRPGRRRPLRRALILCLGLAACTDTGDRALRGETDEGSVVPAQVLRSFPHDPAAFTQGLVVSGDTLLESTGGRGESTLRKVELSTGRVLQSVHLPAPYFGEGIAVLGDRIYQLTWQEHTGFIYDHATLERTGTFQYAGEGWGLTSDGRSLILSDGTSVLRYLDPETFEVSRTMEVHYAGAPVQSLNELEWVRGELWANVWHQDEIARIDPATGEVRGWISLAGYAPPVRHQNPEAVPNGIAYDARTGRLYVTGTLWGMLYEIRVPPIGSPDAR
jgi:glutamine cyclotransferase